MATSYPGAIDAFNNPTANTAEDATGYEHDLQHANVNDAVEAIETELGTNPSGEYSTVSERFDNLIPWPPDKPPASPTSYDYEFSGSGTALPSGWSWVNQGTSSYVEQYGSGYITIPGATTSPYANRGIFQAIPTDASFEFRTKIRIPAVRSANYWNVGIALYDGTKLMQLGYDTRGVKWLKWNSVSSYSAESTNFPMYISEGFYLSLKKNSATSWDLGFSTDGVAWFSPHVAIDVSAWMTATQIGILVFNEYNSQMTVAVDWFRKVA